jgi:choline dehydrogenase-like flavoprotein
VEYELSRYDAANLRAALRGAAEVLASQGATELVSLHQPPVRARPGERGSLASFGSAMDARGYNAGRVAYIAFHQMASCAMGADPARSVVGETGESHEVKGLYVADASAFVTSSGVNPMITIMAIADHVARAMTAT